MTETGAIELGGVIVTVILFLIGLYLAAKDHAHDSEIKELKMSIRELWTADVKDVSDLRDLREVVAGRHYERDELDAKFDKLETTFKDGFKDMGGKFDRMTDAMLAHLAKEGDRTGKFERSGQ